MSSILVLLSEAVCMSSILVRTVIRGSVLSSILVRTVIRGSVCPVS